VGTSGVVGISKCAIINSKADFIRQLIVTATKTRAYLPRPYIPVHTHNRASEMSRLV
jgi:hypothetical protein